MKAMTAGVTKASKGIDGHSWNILGQTYVPKTLTESPSPGTRCCRPAPSCRRISTRPRTSSSTCSRAGSIWCSTARSPSPPGDLIRLPRRSRTACSTRATAGQMPVLGVADGQALRSVQQDPQRARPRGGHAPCRPARRELPAPASGQGLRVCTGSWLCENDFGPAQVPLGCAWMGQDRRREQVFSAALDWPFGRDGLQSQSQNPRIQPCKPIERAFSYALIASINFSTPTMLSTRVRL